MKLTIAAFALFSLGSLIASAGQLTGYISDTKCAAENAKAAKASDWIHPKVFESCAQMCVKGGSEAIFLTEDNKVVKFDADSKSKALAHLGHKVTVNGKIENGVLKIDSIDTVNW